MATAAEPQVKDWECSICHEPFTIPKLIFCGHVLCRHCLLSWLTSKQEALCPLCRRAIISDQSHPDQSLECVVDSFPTDETMRIWVECEKLLQKDHTCQSCVTQAATSLCLHCHDFLCSSCTAMHGRLSSTRHHAVESLASLTAEQLVANYSSPCQGHPSERSQLYCSTHQESICWLCSSTKHRNCPEVKDLKETASETQEVFSGLVETLSAQETKLNEAVQELDDFIQETDSQMEAALAKLDKTFDGLEASLKISRQQAKESTVRAFTESRQSAQDCRTHLLQERGALTTHRTVAERGKPMAPSGDLGQMAVAMKKRVSDLVKSPLRPADGKVVKTATAAIRSEAVSSVEKALAELAQDVVKIMPANVVAKVCAFHSLSLPQSVSFSCYFPHWVKLKKEVVDEVM
ncbi:protein meiotic P26-like [Babylonia areolata]|uniref:protein meiotic P26-like n=1 Tax=Babylonia areolata TaxID=304850 RepID=UPI003FD471C9